MNTLSRYLVIGIVMGAMHGNAAEKMDTSKDANPGKRKSSSPFEPIEPTRTPSRSPEHSPRLPGGSPADPYLWGSMSRSSSVTSGLSTARTLSGTSASSLSSVSSQTSSSASTSSAEPSPLSPTPPSISWESKKKQKTDKDKESKEVEAKTKQKVHEVSKSDSDELQLETPEPSVPLASPIASDTTVPIVARLTLPSPDPTEGSPTEDLRGGLQNFSFVAPAPRLPAAAQAVMEQEKKKKLSEERDGSDSSEGETKLMEAAYARDIEDVKQQVRDGADVNAQDGNGRTALHHAVSAAITKGDSETVNIINYLLEAKANAHIKSNSGQTAGEEARHYPGPGVIVELLTKASQASKPSASSSG